MASKEKEMIELERTKHLFDTDIEGLIKKNADYGESWKKRGGVGAFMNVARKWDRIETQVMLNGGDLYAPKLWVESRVIDPFVDDVIDLRGYLLLCIHHQLGMGLGEIKFVSPYGHASPDTVEWYAKRATGVEAFIFLKEEQWLKYEYLARDSAQKWDVFSSKDVFIPVEFEMLGFLYLTEIIGRRRAPKHPYENLHA
jgi:hypothetical protein